MCGTCRSVWAGYVPFFRGASMHFPYPRPLSPSPRRHRFPSRATGRATGAFDEDLRKGRGGTRQPSPCARRRPISRRQPSTVGPREGAEGAAESPAGGGGDSLGGKQRGVGGRRDRVSSGRDARTGGPASAAPAGGVSRQGREEANTADAGEQRRGRCFCDAAGPFHHCRRCCATWRTRASMGWDWRRPGSWHGVGRVRLRGDGRGRGRVSPVRA